MSSDCGNVQKVFVPVEKEKEVFRPRQALFVWPLGLGVLTLGIWVVVLIVRN